MESTDPVAQHTPGAASLPMYLTRFVGRERERERLHALLLGTRLLTLVGVGGIGKTRLALQLAAEVATSFSNGVYMIELASLSEPRLIPQAIASALGIRTDRDTSLLSLLISALGQRHVLLLLDNCEHVLSECAPLAEALLRACPQLHILATSREPLTLPGETVWRVAALSSPAPSQMPPVEQLLDYEALQLFCERAAESQPRFHLTSHNASAVVRICQHLDGLPLALELAAALLPVLSAEQIAARLSERFALLKHGRRTAPARQQTLQATLDWSYSLLTPAEQALFAHLAIFAGSWNIDAIEQICGPTTSEGYATFDLLTRLVNTSLVIAEEQEGLEEGATEVRYRLLDTMHQYALEKLQQTDLWQLLCERHAAWYMQLAQHADAQLYGAEQPVWLHCLEMEMANLRAALTRALASGQLDAAARLADALRRFWIIRNNFSEGRYWFETLLSAERDDQQLSPALRARVLFGASEFARYQGSYTRASTLLREQVALLETLGDTVGLMEAQTYLGVVIGLQGDYEQGIRLSQASLDFYRREEHHGGMTTALTTLAFLTLAQGDVTHALALSQEACHILREAGNRVYLLYALFILAQAALFQGAKEQAREACREALHLAQAQGQTYGIAASLGLIAGLASLDGQPIQAARLLGAAQALQDRVQAPHPPAGRALLERMVLSIRAALGAETFLSHYSAGQACPLEQILPEAEALLQTAPASSPPAASAPSTSSVLAALSPREREILTLVATGLTDAQIAGYLQLSTRTVSKHLQSIYTKLNINSRSAATRIALEQGLV